MTSFEAWGARTGSWHGSNGFRLLPDDPRYEAAAGAEVATHAGGHVVAISYTWSHPADGVQDGLLVLGAGDGDGSVTAFWGDSWHQSPEARVFAGTVDDGSCTVSYEYAPGWRWVIVVDPTDADVLRLRMDNVVPADADEGRDASTYPAMVMELRRPEG